MAPRPPRSSPAAFTLIEILVVIAIIALLVSILLPGLRQARDSARQVVCLATLKQVETAMISYSMDFRVIPGAYWQGPINLDWCGRNNQIYQQAPQNYRHPLQASVLHEYFGTDITLICPTGKRPNQFFDYTMLIRMAGAKPDLAWYVSYPVNPALATSPRKNFIAMPLLIEEDETWYNVPVDDGSFAWNDQWSTRHFRSCNIAFLDGSAAAFKSPKGPRDDLEEPADLKTLHLRLHVNRRTFSLHYSAANEFGWINGPR
jgi:prepilin-type N-terminal cleavage/methylation domain-containing protein/prepilin-type processing-associated H-X9-DG protein